MIERMIQLKGDFNRSDFDKANYHAVLQSNAPELIANIENHIDEYVTGVYLDISTNCKEPEEELIKRLVKRGQTSGRPDDDNDQVIKVRILEYHKKTSPVADHYKKANKVVLVKGEGSVDDIFKRLTKEIDSRIQKN